jgi:hypothetical protein
MIKTTDYGDIDFCALIGETIVSIDQKDDEIIFNTLDNQQIKMYHEQDCCEDVTIEDICGNIRDLIGSPISIANENTNEGDSEYGHTTWTFYVLGTNKGSVTIRWHGESNGYYSESVNLVLL